MQNSTQNSFQLSDALKTFATPFLNTLGCNYFQYLKVNRDGSFSYLTTQPHWDEFTLQELKKRNQPAVYSHIDTHTLDKHKFTFLWDPNLPEEPVRLARQFNIANGFTFVERYEDFYYMFGFASPVGNKRAIDTYFNSLNSMHDFLQAFKYQQRKLIADIDTLRIHVPKSRQDCNLNTMLLTTQKPKHLTAQELACIKGLAKSMSYKEIAKSLNLSPRTVETYINRVRLRYGLQYKKDLVALL